MIFKKAYRVLIISALITISFCCVVYADFWDTKEMIDPEAVMEHRKQDDPGLLREDTINLSLIGFDIENNPNALQMLNDMAAAAKETGAKTSVVLAGNEDIVELEKAMSRTVDEIKSRSNNFAYSAVEKLCDIHKQLYKK